MRAVATPAAILVLSAGAAAAQDAAGYWSGSIEVPGVELGVAVTLAQDEGVWSGRVDLADQGIRGLALAAIDVDGRGVRFALPRIPGSPLFDGKLSGDGKILAGEFIQHGERYPFELVRGTAPTTADEDPYREYLRPGVPGDGPAGTWNGVLTSGPARLRMSLILERDGDGRLGGTLHSVDQRDARLPVTGVARMNDRMLIDIESIGAVLNVRMSPDGSTLEGRWEQEPAGIDLPLKLSRTP